MHNKTDKSASRRRTRRLGMLAMLLSALLTPAGTIVAGAAVTALVVGSVVIGTPLDEPAAATADHSLPTPRPAASADRAGAPYTIPIEYDGQAMQVALAENVPGADAHPTGFESTAQPFATPDQTGGTAGPRAVPPAPPRPPIGAGRRPDADPSNPSNPGGAAEPDGRLPPTTSRPEPFEPETYPQGDEQAPSLPAADLPSGPSTTPGLREADAPRLPADERRDGRGAARHAVPEPSAWGLLLLGGAALAIARRRRSVAGAA